MPSLIQKLASAYRARAPSGAGVLLAVSGGADSTALLLGSARLAAELGLRLEVASLDHGLRRESAREVAAVRSLAKRLSLPFHTRRLRLRRGAAVEERAREARYRTLEELRVERDLAFVATAHTADDQAETVLMRLARGAALRGAGGILPVRGHVLRPMLACTRAEVEGFLSGLRQSYAQDPTNRDRRLLRARVRHDVLPALEAAAGPGAAWHLACFAALAQEDEAFIDAHAAAAYDRLVMSGGLERIGLLALVPPLRRRVLARLLESCGVSVDGPTLGRAELAVRAGRSCALPQDRLLVVQGGAVRCRAAPARTIRAPRRTKRYRLA